jgi:hypothetical protein
MKRTVGDLKPSGDLVPAGALLDTWSAHAWSDGVMVDRLSALDRLLIRTRHSDYEIVIMSPESADVLVRVHATAVNLLDSKVRDGGFKIFLPYRPPFVLGHDGDGVGQGLIGGEPIGLIARALVAARPIIGGKESERLLPLRLVRGDLDLDVAREARNAH